MLVQEWGYKGLVMSDWIGVWSTSESIKAGLDLEMPYVFPKITTVIPWFKLFHSGPTVMRGKAVERALIGEKIFPKDVDDRVRKVYSSFQAYPISALTLHIDPRIAQTGSRIRRPLRRP